MSPCPANTHQLLFRKLWSHHSAHFSHAGGAHLAYVEHRLRAQFAELWQKKLLDDIVVHQGTNSHHQLHEVKDKKYEKKLAIIYRQRNTSKTNIGTDHPPKNPPKTNQHFRLNIYFQASPLVSDGQPLQLQMTCEERNISEP